MQINRKLGHIEGNCEQLQLHSNLPLHSSASSYYFSTPNPTLHLQTSELELQSKALTTNLLLTDRRAIHTTYVVMVIVSVCEIISNTSIAIIITSLLKSKFSFDLNHYITITRRNPQNCEKKTASTKRKFCIRQNTS